MTEEEVWAALRIMADVLSNSTVDGKIPPGKAEELTALMQDAAALLANLRRLVTQFQEIPVEV